MRKMREREKERERERFSYFLFYPSVWARPEQARGWPSLAVTWPELEAIITVQH